MRWIGLCACVAALFLASPIFAGNVVTTGDWTQTSQGGHGAVTGDWGESSATAHLDGFGTYEYGYATAEGWESTYTTETEYRSYWYRVYAWAEAETIHWDGADCVAVADVWYANAYAPDSSREYSAAAYLEWVSGYGGLRRYEYDGSYSDYVTGYAQFGPSVDLYCEHSVGTCCVVFSNTSEEAFAHACGRAYGGLW